MAIKIKPSIMNSCENLASKVSFWNVDLPKSPWDMDDDLDDMDKLCELVRDQYLKRLRQTLLDNLDVVEDYQKGHSNKIEECVNICMAEMEKQALKRCMMASIYRESMSRMINKVKTCTNNSMLFVLLKHIIESNNQSPNQFNRTAGNTNSDLVSVGVNTELKLNKVVSTQTENCPILDNNLSTNMSVKNVDTDHVNISVSPSSSYDVKSKISESNVFNNLNLLLKSPSHSYDDDVPMEINDKHNVIEFSNVQTNLEKSDYTTNDFNSLLKDLQDSPEYEQHQPLIKLDERLTALGLAIENYKSTDTILESPTSNYLSPNTVRIDKVKEILLDKFKSERIAKSYELRRSMNELPQEQQKRLNQMFKDLFGNNHTYESDPLSQEEEHIIAHKRIVKMVVEFMTPYYKANRISRQMFKILARIISKNIMNRAYDSDSETVARGVNEFFTGNRCIKTLDDIYQ